MAARAHLCMRAATAAAAVSAGRSLAPLSLHALLCSVRAVCVRALTCVAACAPSPLSAASLRTT